MPLGASALELAGASFGGQVPITKLSTDGAKVPTASLVDALVCIC